ncbi:MAG: hypothetical protein ACOC33_00090 [bacterium]
MSRLLENSEDIRQELYAKNLYTPSSVYDINESAVDNAINIISGVLNPGNSFDFRNTIVGRTLEPLTPIAQLGNRELAKNLLYQAASRIRTDIVPVINVEGIFNKDVPFIEKRENYTITKDSQLRDFSIEGFLNRVVGYYKPENIFKTNKREDQLIYNSQTLINNTGRGQLLSLENNINRNFYYPFYQDINYISIEDRLATKVFFSADRVNTNFDNDRSNLENQELKDDVREIRSGLREDIKNQYIGKENINLYGKTDTRPRDRNLTTDEATFGINDNILNQYIHGGDNNTKFNVRTGLLRYTKGLLGALKPENQTFDQTKSVFVNGTEVNFRGSMSGRTHTVLDQYNEYSDRKLIRFTGNKKNENSVIYDSVIPKFHPLLDDNSGQLNKRNMMFSIENLAYYITGDKENGFENNDGTPIPECEVGGHKGRLMWFMPYGIELSENSVAKWETTEMIGRVEPIYTYNNSERLATLSFKLLIDYPDQVFEKGYEELAKFFNFGDEGERVSNQPNKSKLRERLQELQEEKNNIKQRKIFTKPDSVENIIGPTYYFRNDSSTIESTEPDPANYESFSSDSGDSVEFGLYNEVFYGLNTSFQEGVNSILSIMTGDTREFYKYIFVGNTSSPATIEYNLNLSRRRANSLKDYIESQLGTSFESLGISNANLEIRANGETLSDQDLEGQDPIFDRVVKENRNAEILLVYNGRNVEEEQPLTPDQIQRLNEIDRDIDETERLLKELQSSYNCVFERLENGDKLPVSWQRNRYISPVFHSQTPEDFHKRLTFLQQCVRPGSSERGETYNSIFGRPPYCILRLGDFYHTKMVIDNINFDYIDSVWDQNPESNFGMQYMLADITMSIRVIGGQSLAVPIERLQNAISFNYYANSTFLGADGQNYYRKAYEAESGQTELNISKGFTF